MEISPEDERRQREGAVAIVEVDLHRPVAMVAAEKIRPPVAVQVGDGGTAVFPATAVGALQTGGTRYVDKGVSESGGEEKGGEEEKEKKNRFERNVEVEDHDEGELGGKCREKESGGEQEQEEMKLI